MSAETLTSGSTIWMNNLSKSTGGISTTSRDIAIFILARKHFKTLTLYTMVLTMANEGNTQLVK